MVEGEISGYKVGIYTDLILWEHCQALDLEKLDREYLIGFGVGFTKGQSARKRTDVGALTSYLLLCVVPFSSSMFNLGILTISRVTEAICTFPPVS